MSRCLAIFVLCWALPALGQRALGPKEAVEIALRENPTLAAAVASMQRASWAVIGEDAAFTPVLQLDLGGLHSESPAFQNGNITRAGVDQLTVGSRIIQRLRLGTDLSLRVEHNSRWDEGGRDVSLFAVGPVYDTSARLELTQPFWPG